MKKVYAPIIISCFIMTIGCNSALDTSSDEQKIKEHIQNWIDVSEKGDTDGYFNLISDEFVYYGPDGPPIDNLDSLRAFLEPFFKDNSFSMPKWETNKIIVQENMAIHMWSGIGYIESKIDGSKIELDRNYMDVYRKDKRGEWKCILHSFHSNH